MAIKQIKTSFNAGELSEYVAAREDLAKYHNGCSIASNVTVLPHGGVVTRSGTRFIARAKGACKLFGFEFSSADRMILEMGNLYCRFFKSDDRIMDATAMTLVTAGDAGIILSGTGVVKIVTTTPHGYATNDVVRIYGTPVKGAELVYSAVKNNEYIITYVSPTEFTLNGTNSSLFTQTGSSAATCKSAYEIVTPYDATDVFEIHVARSGDVYYITHEDHAIQKLTRVGGVDNTWTIAALGEHGGPFLTENTDTTDTLTFTHYTGAHITTDNSAALIVAASTFVDSTLVGYTVYNLTDGSSGVIIANTATGVTATLAGGADNNWDIGDLYSIGLAAGFYHSIGAVGTLVATGHTPFVADHVGSKWRMKETITSINYATLSGAVATNTYSEEIEIKGDFSVDCTGFDTDTTVVTLQRKAGGTWQNYRKFASATAYSSTEEEDGIYYRLRYTGSAAANAGFTATLTAKEQFNYGVVKIINVVSSSSAVCVVTEKLFTTPSQSDVAITSLTRTGTTVTVEFTGTVAVGDDIIFKNISAAAWSFLNYYTSGASYRVLSYTDATPDTFTFNCGVSGNINKTSSGVGEFYVMGEVVATYEWAEGAFSLYQGYPKAVTFHGDRLYFGGAAGSPTTVFGSRVGEYDDFTTGVYGDDAVSLTIQDDDVSQIEWLKSKKVLVAGTGNKEFLISAQDANKPITPNSDNNAVVQSSNGSNHIQPVDLNDGIFYCQRQGKKMRIMLLNEYGDQMKSTDATLLSNHIFFDSPAVAMAVQRTPDSIVWAVREDGTLCPFTYEPTELVEAWTRAVTGGILDQPVGFYTSVAIISGSVEDDIWVSVKRVIGGTDYYYLEKFGTRFFDQLDQAITLDSARVVTSAFSSQDIVYASDTVRYDNGLYGSARYGGTV